AGLSNLYVATDRDDCDVYFHSDDNSVYLRRKDDWWVIDTVNDRGKRYNDVASFSEFDLAEKFLIWQWASFARSAIGARQLGAELHAQGPMTGVAFTPASRDYFVELHAPTGRAIVSEASSVVISHVMTMTLSDLHSLVTQGLN
ncbi:MAG: hypothetical protein ACRDDJ_04600, partial [[Mycobacterium] stephanolepidis]